MATLFKIIATLQIGVEGSLDQDSSGGGSEKWSYFQSILMQSKQDLLIDWKWLDRKKGVKDDHKFLTQATEKMKCLFSEMRMTRISPPS